MVGVLHIMSQVCGVLAFALLAPAAVGLLTGEAEAAGVFLAVAGLVGFVAGAIFFAFQGRAERLDRVSGFVLLALVWIIPPLAAAIPLMRFAGLDFMTALFQTVSAYTTTGAVALPSVQPLGFTGVFFLAELQWLGGLMTLLTVATVLAPTGLGGISARGPITFAAVDDRSGRVWGVVRQVAAVYSLITLACILLLFTSGIRPFDAVCLAFATVSTGGFMPLDGDLSAYGSVLADFVLAIFMLIGATSIVWHRMIFEGRWHLLRHHSESYWVIGVALIAGLGYATAFGFRDGAVDLAEGIHALGDGLLAGISLVTTTGFEPRADGISALPSTIVIILAIIGGGALSTAGGIKYYRIGAMFVQSLDELRRLIYPHGVRGRRLDQAAYDAGMMKGIWSNIAVCLVAIGCSALLMGLVLPTYDGALTAAVAAFSNIGPLYAAGWTETAGWPPYAAFDGFAKGVMVVTMILGRVEVLAMLAAVNVAYWRS